MSSIFLSHNYADKPFARRLAKDLERLDIEVWLDEAEIKIGDSLIEKIREGIDQMEYLGVILTKNSIDSEWVKKEIDIAMNQEIAGKKVKILPILLENCELPGFLVGKLYADFRLKDDYQQEFKKIASRLGVKFESTISLGKDSSFSPSKNLSLNTIIGPTGKLFVEVGSVQVALKDVEGDFRFDSWELLNSLERYMLGYASNPKGITLSKVSKLFATSTEQIEEAFEKLNVNGLVEEMKNKKGKAWRITEDGEKFRKQNYWSKLV